MRIRDILKEDVQVKLSGKQSKIEADFDEVSPGMITFKELRNTDAYMQYRMGIAITAAMNDNTDFEQETPYAENMIFVTYAPAEEEMIRKAAKIMGVTPTQAASRGSREPSDIDKTSLFSRKK
jgi:hypothetical protein